MEIGAYQNKLRVLLLLQILWQETDDEHALSRKEIEEHLQIMGMEKTYDRKTFYDDVKALQALGVDIEMYTKNGTGYYQLISREFELAEMKLLVDSVQAAKFIPEEKTKRLINKMEHLVSKHEGKKLERQVMIGGRVKMMNESIFYNIDTLHNAINANHQIRFRYFQYDVNKNKVYRHNGDWYVISPWGLLWDDENYYLVAYDAVAECTKHYRVDKMEKIEELETYRLGETAMAQFDFSNYNKSLFGMFTGELVRVGLVCENSMIGVMLDRFGKDILVQKVDEAHFKTYVPVAISNQFFGWIFALGGGVRIVSPPFVVERMHNLAGNILAMHKGENNEY